MNAEELRINRANGVIAGIIAQPNITLDEVINKVDAVAREIWKDFPRDVNFLTYGRVENAKRLFLARSII